MATSPTTSANKGRTRQCSSLREIMAKGRKVATSRPDEVLEDPYDNYSKHVNLIRRETALYYSLNQHECVWDKKHPENPNRFIEIEKRLKELNLESRCCIKRNLSKVPEIKEEFVLTKHSTELLEKLKSGCMMDAGKMEELCSKYDSVYINEHTFNNALIAVQTVYNLAKSVASNEFQNGLAVVRPPGHHAMENEFNGFCFFNNVAITAHNLIKEGLAKKILIVDYDVHHGQGTQKMFYDRNDVLYFSIHRYEHGTFWPNLKESNSSYIGEGDGKGYNINVPLNEIGCSDSDYLAIILQILLPVAYEFNPDMIIISAGYDAAIGCPEGEMVVTPAFYGHLVTLLSGLAQGKIVVALEGGYNTDSLAEGVAMTLKGLLGDPCGCIDPLANVKPCIIDSINNCKFHLRNYWQCFKINKIFDYPRKLSEGNLDIEAALTINNLEEYLVSEIYFGVPDTPPFLTRGAYPLLSTPKMIHYKFIIENLKLEYYNKVKPLTGYVYDKNVILHKPPDEVRVLENPDRISRVIDDLDKNGILKRMVEYSAKKLGIEELKKIHDGNYLESTIIQQELPDTKDLYVNAHTKDSILASVGAILSLIDGIVSKDIMNGLAVVRPPGHHARYKQAGGFCFVNNVVAAARYATEKHSFKRVLIVDFDIHHGDGTQELTYNDCKIMYISVHRYDNGTYFPKSHKADYNHVGSGLGEGYNVNIPFNGSKMGNAEYLLTFTNIVLPIAYAYSPDLVLVSSGYDAGIFDPLGGGYTVYPEMYGHLIKLLKPLAKGNLILCLEGGYNLTTLGYSVVMSAKALLGDPIPMPKLKFPVNSYAIETLHNVINIQKKYWPVLMINKKIGSISINSEMKNSIQSILSQLRMKGTKTDEKKMEKIICEFNSLTKNNN